jgi:ribokinase
VSARARVACLACWNVDLTLRVAHLPGDGETVFGDAFDIGPGGKGSNVAVGAARLGAQVDVIARLGDDDFGRRALPFWRAEGIGCDQVEVAAGEPNAVASILVDGRGENRIAVFRGAGYRLSARQVHAARATIERAAVLTMPLELQDEAIGAALAVAQEAGVRTILNPAPARALPSDWLAAIDVLTPNALEARQLIGLAADASLLDAGQRLLERGIGAVVMTCGSEGAWLFESGKAPLSVPALAVQAVDTVGAGDAFNAGLAVALAEGASLPDAARFASATAALATTREGAAAAMPRRAEVNELINRPMTKGRAT